MLKPGWVESFALGLSEKLTEEERSAVIGLKPRARYSNWSQISKASALRGSAKVKRRLKGVPKRKEEAR